MKLTHFKYHKRFLFSLFGGFLCFMACEQDIDLVIPDQKKLVLISNFTPDSLFRLYLSSTIPIGNANQTLFNIPNARIQLFEDGNYIEDFIYQNDDIEVFTPYYFVPQIPKSGIQYSILARVEGYPEVNSNNVFPDKVPIESFDIESAIATNDPIDPSLVNFQLKTQLDLESTSTNTRYFHLRLWRNLIGFEVFGEDTITSIDVPKFLETPMITSNEVSHIETPHEPGTLIELPPNIVTIDISFILTHYPEFELKSPLYIELQHVSEDYYRFHKSVGLQENANFRESILSAQAIPIYNNVDGGIGNFSGYSVTLDSLIW